MIEHVKKTFAEYPRNKINQILAYIYVMYELCYRKDVYMIYTRLSISQSLSFILAMRMPSTTQVSLTFLNGEDNQPICC